MVDALAAAGRDADGAAVVDKVVGMEARGFILGAPVALALGVGFVPVRKAGKLPARPRGRPTPSSTARRPSRCTATRIAPGERVLLVDDVLATGGTAAATRELVERCGGTVHAVAVLMELVPARPRALGAVTVRTTAAR